PRAGMPSVHLFDIVTKSSGILGGDYGFLLINDPAQFSTVDLNRTVHVFDNSVAAPFELCERIRPECRRATWCNRDHTHVALPILVNCMRNPIRETADRKSTRLNSSHVSISYA